VASLACYRLRSHMGGRAAEDYHQAIDAGALDYIEYGPTRGHNFTAYALVIGSVPHDTRWAGFVRSGFDPIDIPPASSPGALLVVEVPHDDSILRFAFAFGSTGRFLLARDSYEHGFGLTTALNVIYPKGTAAAYAARLRSVDSKRRGPTIMRSKSQASEVSAFEEFDINRLQDVVTAAVGIPDDTGLWGARVSGGDPFRTDISIEFADLGDLCIRLHEVHESEDYAESFGWIDDIQPVTDPGLRERLENEVLRTLVEEDGASLALAVLLRGVVDGGGVSLPG